MSTIRKLADRVRGGLGEQQYPARTALIELERRAAQAELSAKGWEETAGIYAQNDADQRARAEQAEAALREIANGTKDIPQAADATSPVRYVSAYGVSDLRAIARAALAATPGELTVNQEPDPMEVSTADLDRRDHDGT